VKGGIEVFAEAVYGGFGQRLGLFWKKGLFGVAGGRRRWAMGEVRRRGRGGKGLKEGANARKRG
jgi:hypothetical protein